MKTILQLVESCQKIVQNLTNMIPSQQYKNRLDEINNLSNDPKLWADVKIAASLMKEHQKII